MQTEGGSLPGKRNFTCITISKYLQDNTCIRKISTICGQACQSLYHYECRTIAILPTDCLVEQKTSAENRSYKCNTNRNIAEPDSNKWAGTSVFSSSTREWMRHLKPKGSGEQTVYTRTLARNRRERKRTAGWRSVP